MVLPGRTRRFFGVAVGATPVRLLFFGLTFLVALDSLSLAGTITVDGSGGAAYTEIQPAINAAKNGDTVLVKPGTYVVSGSISFGGKAITLQSEGGAEGTTIERAPS